MKVLRVSAPKPAEHRSIGPALHAVGAMHGYGCTSFLGAETPDLTLDRRVVLTLRGAVQERTNAPGRCVMRTPGAPASRRLVA